MAQREGARDDGGVAAGRRAGAAGGVGLRAVGRVATPDDSRRNRSAVGAIAAWGRTRRSSLAGRRAGPRIPPEFRPGAGPRRLGRSWWPGRWRAVALPRPRLTSARPGRVAARARSPSIAVVVGSDSVGPDRGGALCPGWWPCNVDRHASVANVERRVGRPGYSTEPGAVGAGTSVHSP